MPRHLSAFLIATALAGCASAAKPVHPTLADGTPGKSANSIEPQPQLPAQALTRDILFKLLVGEVAGQRGEIGLAAEAYADLAKTTRDPRVAKRATEAAMYAQNPEMAIRASRIWMEADPGDEAAAQTHASVLLSAGEFEAAEPVMADVLKRQGSRTGAALLQVGAMLNRSGDRTAALAFAQRLAAPYLKLPEANLLLAQMAFNAGDGDLALRHGQSAVELRRDWEPALLFVAQVTASRDPTAAMQYLGAASKRVPGSRAVGLAYARALAGSSQYPAALVEFKRLAKLHPNDGEIRVTAGALASQVGDAATASEYLRMALESDYAEKDSVRLMLGQVEAERGDSAAALRWYESIQAGSTAYMPAQVSIARLVLKQSGLDAARERLRAVRADTPLEQVQLILSEAALLRESGDDRAAFEVLDAATRDYAGIADLWYDHGMAAERLDMLDVVETSLRKVIELKPDHAHAYNALGFSLADRNVRLLEARGYIEQALQLQPEDPYIIDSLGWVQYRLGELEEAEKTLRRAMSIKDDPEVVAHLAEVLVKRGKADEAGKLIAGGLRKNPGNSVLQAAQSRLLP
ncbi:MAG: tetratricopeptide repeat protein [Rhodocyclaceae bacterium]|nr:tetratricopeptide repeat protein [Rhodocyclaceae bacterium]